MEPTIYGRESELAEIEDFLAGHERMPSALLIQGAAGIGKTTLWRQGVVGARNRGFEVLVWTAAPSEARIAFSALGDLIGGLLDEALESLPPPQRRALEVALLLRDPGGQPPDQRAVGAACLSSLHAVAADRPVLIAIDDVQWLDRSSADVLGFVVRRLRDLPVGFLLGMRIEGRGTSEPLGLERSLGQEHLSTLLLSPLSMGAIHALIHDRLGETLARPVVRQLHEVSEGNPFYALEIARALQARQRRPTPGEPFPIPDDLQELIRDRLHAMSEEVREVLLLTECTANPTLSLLTAAIRLAGGDVEAIDEAVEADAIEVSGDRVRVAHPLLASAMYSETGPGRRREMHRRLAGLVEDPEAQAWHLALAADGPDSEIASRLEEAARKAFARGAPAAAADLCERARRLTPAGRVDEVGLRTIEEADYAFAAGDAVRASGLLEEVLANHRAGELHVEALGRLARLRYFVTDLRSAADLFAAALAKAEEDPALLAELEEGLAWALLLMRDDLSGALAHAAASVEHAEATGDKTLIAQALAIRALSEFHLGRLDAPGTMARALALESWTEHLRVLRRPSFAHAYMLGRTDDLGAARSSLEALVRRAESLGDESALPAIYTHLGWVEFLAGSWDTAIRYADTGHDIAMQTGQPPYAAELLSVRALVESHRGEAEAARDSAGQALALAGTDLDRLDPLAARAGGAEWALWALGALELSLGNIEESDRYLRPLSEAVLGAGLREPGEMRFLPDHVEALTRLARFEEAERFLVHFEKCAREQERASARAAALRCRGIMMAAKGDPDAALEPLESALLDHDPARFPFERARTELALGATRRRLNRKRVAREALDVALRTFEELGAAIWAQHARSELERISGRAPALGLTVSERRVAELAAAGKSNRDIAADLYLAVRTVETHLSHVYAKLGITSRVELVRRLKELQAEDR